MNTDKETGLRRLLQLADHLENGQLGHKIFDFTQWNSNSDKRGDDYKRANEYDCGTCGCAIGECPILWPAEWRFGMNGDPELIGKPDVMWPIEPAREFFALEGNEPYHLFLPEHHESRFGGEPLGEDATKLEVAANIRAFVAIKARELGIELTEETKASNPILPIKAKAFGENTSQEVRTTQPLRIPLS